ncbi:MAG TPA: glycosyltransferase [Nocardioidaceae bacterium]|nr:glycosyltransferase [Nocardioidaceae bacterium]
MSTASGGEPHLISVVVPVYAGERTLPGLVTELTPMTSTFTTPDGHSARVTEIVLVHDHGPDESARVLRSLAAGSDVVRLVWLSRNFGQHAATIAGMASAGGDWIVTLDEDGQHDPADIPALLDRAMAEQVAVVYAHPVNGRQHGPVRNLASTASQRLVNVLASDGNTGIYHSYRLMLGEAGRGVAAYAGAGDYLDVALGWVAGRATTCSVTLRAEGSRPSGYRLRSLLSHFWRLVLTSGTRLLRLVALVGALFALVGIAFAVFLVANRLLGGEIQPGWTSVMVAVLVGTGAILLSLGIVAEYLGIAVNMAMGKPLYLISADPGSGPLGRSPEQDGG